MISAFIIIISLLSPFIRITAYLSACGLNFSWISLPNYPFGAFTICNLESLGLEYALMPIPCK